MAEYQWSNVLLIALNVLLVGAVWVVVGRMLVGLLRRLLLDGLPPVEEAGREEE